MISALQFTIPKLGTVISFLLYSWLYAFYCFDYKWTMQGWSLQKRMAVFETRWIYMLGFGAPCAVIATLFPLFTGAGIYAMVFPLCVILAILSTPADHSGILPRRLPIFYIAQMLNLKTIELLGPSPSQNKGKETIRQRLAFVRPAMCLERFLASETGCFAGRGRGGGASDSGTTGTDVSRCFREYFSRTFA